MTTRHSGHGINTNWYRTQWRDRAISSTEFRQDLFKRLKLLFTKWVKDTVSRYLLLDLVVMESGLQMLPKVTQTWVRQHKPSTPERASVLVDESGTAYPRRRMRKKLKNTWQKSRPGYTEVETSSSQGQDRSGEDRAQQTIIHQVYPREDREVLHGAARRVSSVSTAASWATRQQCAQARLTVLAMYVSLTTALLYKENRWEGGSEPGLGHRSTASPYSSQVVVKRLHQ